MIIREENNIGDNFRIWNNAVIDYGCTIGNNVKIGAMAVVRESVVGDGAYIANNASVELSVIGEHCALQGGAVVQYSVLYPGVLTTTHFVNASMCGRDSFIAAGAVPTDFRFDGNSVTVMKNNAKVDTGNSFLGACLGHGAYMGSGCILAPGRAVPNGLKITPGDERVLSGFNSGHEIEGFRIIRRNNGREAAHSKLVMEEVK